MTEISYFWDGSTLGDAQYSPYSSEQFADFLSAITPAYNRVEEGCIYNPSDAIYGGLLAPSASGGGIVTVDPGKALVDGKIYTNDAPIDFDCSSEGYHLIVLRKSWSTQLVRMIRLYNVSSPPTKIQVDGVTWDIPIALAHTTATSSRSVSPSRSPSASLSKSPSPSFSPSSSPSLSISGSASVSPSVSKSVSPSVSPSSSNSRSVSRSTSQSSSLSISPSSSLSTSPSRSLSPSTSPSASSSLSASNSTSPSASLSQSASISGSSSESASASPSPGYGDVDLLQDMRVFVGQYGGKELFVPAVCGYQGANFTGTDSDKYGVRFPNSIISRGMSVINIPANFFKNFTVRSIFQTPTPGNAYLQMELFRGLLTTAYDSSSDTISYAAYSIIANTIELGPEFTYPENQPAIGDYLTLDVKRDASNPADTISDNIYFIGWMIYYDSYF